MRIQVLYFAVLRERIGARDEMLELPDGTEVGAALDALAARHPAIAQLRGRFRAAVNEAFAGEHDALRDGDQLALIPPVAGGSDRRWALRDDALSLDRCIAAVIAAGAHDAQGIGAVVTFTGIVRKTNQGHAVQRLEYEAYASMAERELAAICAELEAELPGARVAVEHRVGALAVGELAVVIAAAHAHRGEAFAACRALIDRLKQRVPIWKKELGDDGAEWIGLGA
jgi:molybdopterin synthase catalytic subunit